MGDFLVGEGVESPRKKARPLNPLWLWFLWLLWLWLLLLLLFDYYYDYYDYHDYDYYDYYYDYYYYYYHYYDYDNLILYWLMAQYLSSDIAQRLSMLEVQHRMSRVVKQRHTHQLNGHSPNTYKTNKLF